MAQRHGTFRYSPVAVRAPMADHLRHPLQEIGVDRLFAIEVQFSADPAHYVFITRPYHVDLDGERANGPQKALTSARPPSWLAGSSRSRCPRRRRSCARRAWSPTPPSPGCRPPATSCCCPPNTRSALRVVGEGDLDLVARLEVLDLALAAHRLGNDAGEMVDGERHVGADVEDLVPRRRRSRRESAMAGATSSIWVKARSCSPSPKIVIGSPCRSWFMKMPTTLR